MGLKLKCKMTDIVSHWHMYMLDNLHTTSGPGSSAGLEFPEQEHSHCLVQDYLTCQFVKFAYCEALNEHYTLQGFIFIFMDVMYCYAN